MGTILSARMFQLGTNYCSHRNQSGVYSNLYVCRNLCYKLTLIDIITSFLSTYILTAQFTYIYKISADIVKLITIQVLTNLHLRSYLQHS